jgi:hypothetical protein
VVHVVDEKADDMGEKYGGRKRQPSAAVAKPGKTSAASGMAANNNGHQRHNSASWKITPSKII